MSRRDKQRESHQFPVPVCQCLINSDNFCISGASLAENNRSRPNWQRKGWRVARRVPPVLPCFTPRRSHSSGNYLPISNPAQSTGRSVELIASSWQGADRTPSRCQSLQPSYNPFLLHSSLVRVQLSRKLIKPFY